MEVGLLCPEAGLLEFEVFSVDSATVLLDELERSTCPIDSGNVVSGGGESRGEEGRGGEGGGVGGEGDKGRGKRGQ